jgi:hypothetical protein
MRAFFRGILDSISNLMDEIQAWVSERLSKVRLRGGVVGKVAAVLICFCGAMAAIAATSHLWWVSLICAILLFVLCFPLLWRLVSFAERNPYAALFEGAELLAHERLKLGTKAVPVLSESSAPQPPNPALEDTKSSEATNE